MTLSPSAHTLSSVFNEALTPEITYVAPAEAQRLKGSLATEGKHVTLVGPSGSGKTTVATRTLKALGFDQNEIHAFSGRSYVAATSILEVFGQEFSVAPNLEAIVPWLKLYTLIMIDDVHHLSASARNELASHLKLWHEQGIRLFMIGIAKTSEAILGQDPELAIRNDSWHLDRQDDRFMTKLLEKGERPSTSIWTLTVAPQQSLPRKALRPYFRRYAELHALKPTSCKR